MMMMMMMMTTNQRSTMTTFILWTCVALVFSTLVQGDDKVEISPKGAVAVKVGDKLEIKCRFGQKLRYCRVEIPSQGSMQLVPNDPLSIKDGIEYFGKGLDKGECGVQIANVKESHHGDFKCFLTTIHDRSEIDASVKIIVAKPPQHPEIHLSAGTHGDNRYRTGDMLEVSCISRSGRPAANVSLYLDDEPLVSEDRFPRYDTNSIKDNSVAIVNATHSIDWKDNGKIVRCVAHHIALDQPMESKRELQVSFAPQQTEVRYAFEIGKPGIVNVTIHANPRPSLVWRIGGVEIEEGKSDSDNRLQTSSARELGKGAYLAELTIKMVLKSDTEKEYVLIARNDEGTISYPIALSTIAEPAGVDLDAGSIIGIAVGILVLILVVFLIIFARATGRWCFAGSSTSRNIGESSDTESAGRYSRSEVDGSGSGGRKRPKLTLSKLFKRNKDKVSGADTDTMRTVVTVDDEKVQSTETAVDSHRNPPNEGGIVYAELDLTQQQQGITPRVINDDKTEYAEIVYTKPVDGAETASPEK